MLNSTGIDMAWLEATGIIPLPLRMRRYGTIVEEVAREVADTYVARCTALNPAYQLDTDRYSFENLWLDIAVQLVDADVNYLDFVTAAFHRYGRPYPNTLKGDDMLDSVLPEYYSGPGKYVHMEDWEYEEEARRTIEGAKCVLSQACDRADTMQEALQRAVEHVQLPYYWFIAVCIGAKDIARRLADGSRRYLLASNERRRCYQEIFQNIWNTRVVPAGGTITMKHDMTATPTVLAIKKLQDEGRLTGNVVPASWYRHICRTRGGRVSADLQAIAVLSEVVYWHRPAKPKAGQSSVPKKRFYEDKLQLSYRTLAERLGLSKGVVTAACHRLEKAGFITLESRDIKGVDGRALNNVTYIEVVPDRIRAISPVVKPGTKEFDE
jgi:hypothetical protein